MTKKGVFFCQNRCKNNKFRAKNGKKHKIIKMLKIREL